MQAQLGAIPSSDAVVETINILLKELDGQARRCVGDDSTPSPSPWLVGHHVESR